MIKYHSQVLVLIGVCMSWGQVISEIPGHTGKDTAVAISDTTVVPKEKTLKTDTAVIASVKDTSSAAIKDTSSAAIKDTSSAAIKDTSHTVIIDPSSTTPQDTSAIVSGDQLKPDSVKETPNIIALDTAKSKVSESVIIATEAIPAKKEENKQLFGGRSGIGINLLLKVFNSKEISKFLEDLYCKWKDDVPGVIISESGFSSMHVMTGVNLKGIIYVGKVVGLEPFGFATFGKKMFVVRDYNHDVDISLVDAGGGVNIWARVAPGKCVSFKAGLGGYVCYSMLNVDSYMGEIEFNGIGYGVNILAGVDITLRKMAINIDFLLPVGSTELDQHGAFKTIGSNRVIHYPKEYMHNGFVIRPGVTFQF